MKSKTSRHKIYLLIICITLTGAISCKKFLDVPPPTTSISAENAYKTDATAIAVVTGIYSKIMANDFVTGGITSISLLTDLSADNLVLFDKNRLNYLAYYQNQLDANNNNTLIFGNGDYWSNLYPRIYTINAAISGITQSTTLTVGIKQRLLGECYFLRALFYFYLVNLFGDVPIVTSTDFNVNSTISRSSTTKVYEQIIADLKISVADLNDTYVDGTLSKSTIDRVRPNLSTALALLSRTNLYIKNYADAEATATTIINKSTTYSLLPPEKVFLKNSLETIWAMQPVKTGFNTDEGSVFILNVAPGNGSKVFYASPSLISSFEPNDKRKSSWIGNYTSGGQNYPFIYKYKVDANTTSVTEYPIVFRISEQFLIRAESRIKQNNIKGALEDINAIRNRSGLSDITVTTTDDILKAIMQERRVEFFTEWGHRWFDLKRTSSIDSIMQQAEKYKGGNWATYKSLFPVPNAELILNKNLHQNSGY